MTVQNPPRTRILLSFAMLLRYSFDLGAEAVDLLDCALELVRDRVPVMLEVVIDYGEKTYFSRGVVATNFWRFPWRERLRMLARALLRRLGG